MLILATLREMNETEANITRVTPTLPTIGDSVWFWETNFYYPRAAIVVNCNHEVSPGLLTLRVLGTDGEDITVMSACTSAMQDLVARKMNGEKFVINGHWSPKHPDIAMSVLKRGSHPGILIHNG